MSLVNRNKQICFGSKKLFNDYKNGKISKEELKEKRLLPIYSIGTARPFKGNRHFEILNDLETIIFKPCRGIKFNIKLLSLSKKRLQVLNKLFDKQNEKSISITYKLSNDYILISYEENLIKPKIKSNKIKNRVMAIDLNPNYIGWSIVDWKSSSKYKVIDSGTFSLKQITAAYKKLKTSSSDIDRKKLRNKLEYETYQISKNLLDKALHYKAEVFGVESLKFIKSKKFKERKRNELCINLWLRGKIKFNIQKRCSLFSIKFLEIQANYSSIYGNLVFKSLNKPDMILASIEIGRRAYEFYNQYVTKTKQETKNIIQPRIEDFRRQFTFALEAFSVQDKAFDSWYGLYSYLNTKNPDKNWFRVSFNNINNLNLLKVFRFSSLKSKVCVINTL